MDRFWQRMRVNVRVRVFVTCVIMSSLLAPIESVCEGGEENVYTVIN